MSGEAIPKLEDWELGPDRIDLSEEGIAGVESDFGGLVSGEATGVVRPDSLLELSRVVDSARRRQVRLAIRGGGLSQSGQSLPDRGLVIDMSAWTRMRRVDVERRSVTCDSGVTWRQLLAETIPLGLIPKVHPLNLDLTVGGTLSAGGLGTTSHRQGFAASHVRSAEIVLGTGDLVTTSPTANRDVFDAVFGGVGSVGIIASVELELESAPESVETVVLLYDDRRKMISDQLALSAQPWAFHVGGTCAAAVHGLIKGSDGRRQPLRHWSFGLELTLRSDAEDGVRKAALEGLEFREVLCRETDELTLFLSRYDIRFETMRATGAWQQPHPWFEALIPVKSAENTLEKLMALPAFFGDGHRISVVADTDRPTAIAYPGSGPAIAVAVLPVGVPPVFLSKALQRLSDLDAHIYGLGGRRYLSGWLSRTGEFSWKRHYADQHARLVALKRRFDPAGLFQSKLGSLDPPG